MDAIRVLIVDDHAMVAQGLAEVMDAQPDIEVLAQAGTAAEAERLAGQLSPDVVVMDYRLPDGDGAAATQRIHDQTTAPTRRWSWSPPRTTTR
jgi:DNA-binding NarL/FixJ family response regulator